MKKLIILILLLYNLSAQAQEITNKDSPIILQASVDFVQAIKENDLQHAYFLLSNESRENTTESEFKSTLDGRLLVAIQTAKETNYNIPEVVDGRVVEIVVLGNEAVLALFLDVNPDGTWGIAGNFVVFNNSKLLQIKEKI